MMRRRKKDQRDATRPPRAHPAGAQTLVEPRSRRRARPDMPAPAELRLRASAGESRLDPAPSPVSRSRKAPRAGEVVLVTGFEPFGGEALNPSWEICRQLSQTVIDGMVVEACKVPCEFHRSIEVVAAAIERHQPTLVICLGQAGGRARLGVERVAINVDDARAADNSGAQPVDEAIAANGPPAYFASVPIKAMALAMRAAGAPTEISNSAGTYVCNHLMYGVLHYLAASGNRARAGFIHVPYCEGQVLDQREAPFMAIATMVNGVRAAIAAAREHHHEMKIDEGAAK